MNETITLVFNSIRMVWRFRWLALACALVLAFSGWFFVLLLPDQYQVSTKVFLDTRSVLRPVLDGIAINTDLRALETAALMKRTLLSRPNLELVVRKTDLGLRAKTPKQLEALIASLGKRIKLSGTTRDNIFEIVYGDSDPKMAHRVVEAFLNIFVERSLDEGREDTTSTRAFLDRQIADYEKRLSDAEARVKEFKQNNVGLMPQDGHNYYVRLTDAKAKLANARLEYRAARQKSDELRNQIEGVGSLFEVTIEPRREDMEHPLNARIKELESQLDQLLLRFTDEHPDVRATRNIIAQLRARRNADLDAREALGEPGGGQAQNKIYQDLRVAMGRAEADAAALRARVSEYQRRVTELEELVDTVPEVEAELARLNRDYVVTQTNFDELLKRRESLNLSQEATASTDDYKFKVIEPPKEPLNPEGPNRLLFGAVTFALSLGAGLGLAWLTAFLVPGMYTRDDFEDITSLPVIGTVTRVWTPAERAARRLALGAYVSACTVLLAAFGGFAWIQAHDRETLVRLVGRSEWVNKVIGVIQGFI
ncbi:MAG: XrtA system polysaccharide chain length determinant [Gammaproteobacteria bacterium]